jgi:hypothetical protein
LSVSVAPSDAILLDSWFESEIAPLYARHQELARESIRRKIGALRESVESMLCMWLGRDSGHSQPRLETTQRAARELRTATGAFDDAWRSSFQALDRLREAPDLVIAGIAREAATLVQSTGQHEIEGSWVRSTAQRIAAEHTRDLPNTLAKLALDSAVALKECARDLDTSEAPDAVEFTSAIQEMPSIDLGSIEVHLRAGALARTWTGSAVRSFETKLTAEIGQTLAHAFSAYSSVLQRWIRATLKELRDRFDTYAESYRGRIARVEAPGGGGGTEVGTSIERDLARLKLEEDSIQVEAPA